jgi:hypothetical protein
MLGEATLDAATGCPPNLIFLRVEVIVVVVVLYAFVPAALGLNLVLLDVFIRHNEIEGGRGELIGNQVQAIAALSLEVPYLCVCGSSSGGYGSVGLGLEVWVWRVFV